MGSQAAPGRRHNGWSSADRLAPFADPALGAVALVAALVALLGADVSSIDPRLEAPDAVAVIATAVAAGGLAWRRRRPALSYAAMTLGSLVVSLTDHYIGLLSVLFLLSLYSLAAHGRRTDGLVGLGVGVACFVGLALLDVPDLGTYVLLQSLALLVAAWALGDAVRSRRQHQEVRQRDVVEAAVADERLRIARELHDVVAHSMSLIAVQAGVGAHVIRTDLDAAERSLEVIAETSRRALEQTRSALGLLRETPADPTRPPVQGIDDLAALVADVRGAGLEVRMSCTVSSVDVGTAASLAAYRIVQESLTNTLKHSAARTADVTVAVESTGLVVDVTDPGPVRSDAVQRSGHGLVGLRERARLLGGTCDAGPQGSGFNVRVVLPVGER